MPTRILQFVAGDAGAHALNMDASGTLATPSMATH